MLGREITNQPVAVPNVVLAGVKNNVHAIQCFSGNIRANRDFMVYAAYLHDEGAFKYVSEELRQDRLFFIRVLEFNGLLLQFAHDTLRKDEKLVMKAVKENGLAIQFASDNFRRNRNLIQIAVETSGLALQHVPHEFKSDALMQQLLPLPYETMDWLFNMLHQICERTLTMPQLRLAKMEEHLISSRTTLKKKENL